MKAFSVCSPALCNVQEVRATPPSDVADDSVERSEQQTIFSQMTLTPATGRPLESTTVTATSMAEPIGALAPWPAVICSADGPLGAVVSRPQARIDKTTRTAVATMRKRLRARLIVRQQKGAPSLLVGPGAKLVTSGPAGNLP